MDKNEIICLDLETTGLDNQCDEILQLSIINGAGDVLFNEYLKPAKHEYWDKAMQINGITPKMVENKKGISYHIAEIERIINGARLIVGYNSDYFDIPFLEASGIIINDDIETYDVMLEFAKIFGERDEYHKNYKWQKLTTCANYYGYIQKGNFHDSLEDVKATLYCYFKMQEN